MRPILFDIPVMPLYSWIVFAGVLIVVAAWLLVLHRRHQYTRDHLVTGVVIAAMAALFLVVITRLGAFKVNAYGAALMVGFIVGIISGTRLAARRGIAGERILDLGLVILVSSIIGARLMYMLLSRSGEPFIDWQHLVSQGVGGLSFHGGLLGGLIGSIIYVRVTKLNFWRVADSIAPSVAIGYAITRIGCFLNGCCYGKESTLPWAVDFPHSPDGYIAHVHPTQLYATLMGLAMFGILLWLSRGDGLGRAGRLFMVFLMLEGVERFVMEIFRQPDPAFHGLLTPAQLLCIGLVIAGIAGWFLLPKTPAVIEATAARADAPVTTTPAAKKSTRKSASTR